MDINFSIGNVSAKLERGWFWGGMKIVTPNETLWLQHPLNPLTHFSFRLKRSWSRTVEGQRVTVEKTRPLWIAGARPQRYKIFVGHALVAKSKGY